MKKIFITFALTLLTLSSFAQNQSNKYEGVDNVKYSKSLISDSDIKMIYISYSPYITSLSEIDDGYYLTFASYDLMNYSNSMIKEKPVHMITIMLGDKLKYAQRNLKEYVEAWKHNKHGSFGTISFQNEAVRIQYTKQDDGEITFFGETNKNVYTGTTTPEMLDKLVSKFNNYVE